MSLPLAELTPKQIVAELDKYIVGQAGAKRAVAIALRNRFRRQQLNEADRAEVMPKNILMIGPTGVGKTEIARRLAGLAQAPFVKVEATKFTEVGYVGRDVESMVRELAATAVRLVEAEKLEANRGPAYADAERQVAEMLADNVERENNLGVWGATQFFGRTFTEQGDAIDVTPQPETEEETHDERVDRILQELRDGGHRDEKVSLEVEENNTPFMQVFTPQGMEEMGLDINQLMGRKSYATRDFPVDEAIEIIADKEIKRRIGQGNIHKEAIDRAEQTGIIFIDEIDKIAMPSSGSGPDVSREGVQRDLLPIIEGSTVPSKFGPIRTDHILFICAGAFHESKPSDLIPELQGRLPIRVQLDDLTENDFRRILKEPKNAITKQYMQLLAVDGVEVKFLDSALDEIANIAKEVNNKTQNIGARRLHTVVERLLEDLMYEAPDCGAKSLDIDAPYVREKLSKLAKDDGLSRSIL
jgi:ATP-dependent HslUV protease ATP-binding subunit HslU